MANRRIEITAFRHRVVIATGKSEVENSDDQIEMLNAVLLESVDLESARGQEILIDVIRILERQVKHRG